MAGAIWALATAVSFSFGHITIAKGLPGIGVARGTTLMLVVSALVVAVLTLAIVGTSPMAGAPLLAVGAFAISGLLHYGGWGLMNASLQRVGASRMASITGIAPMFSVILATLFLHEHVNLTIGAGIALIVGGTYLIAAS